MEITDLQYHEVTAEVIGCAMKIHRYFGPGFPEVISKRRFIIELQKANITYTSEIEREIFYEERLIGKRRLDLLVANNILVELKAVTEVNNSCYAQIINYLRVFNIEVGLLLNFGSASLQFKRFVNTNNRQNLFNNLRNP